MGALTAGFWGLVAGTSLLVGALLGLYTGASQRLISIVMSLGAGVLISSVAFDLMDESFQRGGFDATAVGLVSGALIYFAANWAVDHAGGRHRKRSQGQQAGGSAMAITIGALMDGFPSRRP